MHGFIRVSLVVMVVATVVSGEASAAFQPSDLSGLKLWLDASSGVTISGGGYNAGRVGAWDDQTLGSNTTSENVAINGSNLGPTYVGVSAIGGQPAMSFDPTNFTRLENTVDNLVASGGARTVVVVGSAPGAANPGPMFTMRRSGPAFVDRFRTFGGNLYVYEEYPANPQYINGSNLATVQAPFVSFLGSPGTGGSLVTENLNGSNQTVTGSGTIGSDSGATGFTVGAIALDAQTWEGLIAEILVYDRELSAEETNEVGYYLATKYGIETAFVVPEPTSLALVALAGIVAARRRVRDVSFAGKNVQL